MGRKVRCPACKLVATVPATGKTTPEEKGPAAGAAGGEAWSQPVQESERGKRPPVPPLPGERATEKPSPEGPSGGKPPVLGPRPPKPPPLEPPQLKPAGPAPAPVKSGRPKPPPSKLPLAEPLAPESKPPLAEPVKAPEAEASPLRDQRRRGRRKRQRREEPKPLPEKKAEDRKGPREPKPLRTLRPRRRGWFRRGPKVMGPQVYRPDRGRVQSTQWLALILGLVVLFSIGPAVPHVSVETAPGWARLALLLAAVQVVFVVWMLATPDWASVWVLMLVFGFAATVYAVGTAVAWATPLDEPMPLGMGAIRTWAGIWFACVLAVQCLATYLCGRTATRWRHMLRLEMAGRGGTSKKGGRGTP